MGSRVLLNRIAQLHKQHLDLHRAAAQQELDANEVSGRVPLCLQTAKVANVNCSKQASSLQTCVQAWTAQVVHHKQRLATWPEVPVPSANSAAIQSRSAGENGHRGQQLVRAAPSVISSILNVYLEADCLYPENPSCLTGLFHFRHDLLRQRCRAVCRRPSQPHQRGYQSVPGCPPTSRGHISCRMSLPTRSAGASSTQMLQQVQGNSGWVGVNAIGVHV